MYFWLSWNPLLLTEELFAWNYTPISSPWHVLVLICQLQHGSRLVTATSTLSLFLKKKEKKKGLLQLAKLLKSDPICMVHSCNICHFLSQIFLMAQISWVLHNAGSCSWKFSLQCYNSVFTNLSDFLENSAFTMAAKPLVSVIRSLYAQQQWFLVA